jgi:hypothetical protein
MVPQNVIELRPAASASTPVKAVVELDIGPGGSPGLGNPRFVLALAKGFLVVDPEGRSPLNFFGERGTLESQVGSFGSGPGDFSKELSHAADLGDQILVPDYGNLRLAFLDATSKAWVASQPFPSMPTLPLGWVSASPRRMASLAMEPDLAEGHHFEVAVVDRASFRKVESITPAQTEVPSGVYPTGQVLVSGPSPGTFALASPTLGLIEVFDENADPVRAFRLPAEDPRVIDAGDRATLAGAVGGLEQRRFDRRIQILREQGPPIGRQRLEELMAHRPSAEPRVEAEYPSFIQARFDSQTGWLWIALPIRGEEIRSAPYELPWEDLRTVSARWEAYDLEGAFRGRVTVPFGTVVTDVRDDRLFGIRIDSTGARRVVVLRAPVEVIGRK